MVKCGSCLYYKEGRYGGGWCLFNPPVVGNCDVDDVSRPITEDNYLCHEWVKTENREDCGCPQCMKLPGRVFEVQYIDGHLYCPRCGAKKG